MKCLRSKKRLNGADYTSKEVHPVGGFPPKEVHPDPSYVLYIPPMCYIRGCEIPRRLKSLLYVIFMTPANGLRLCMYSIHDICASKVSPLGQRVKARRPLSVRLLRYNPPPPWRS
jgi:hypothetical protein